MLLAVICVFVFQKMSPPEGSTIEALMHGIAMVTFLLNAFCYMLLIPVSCLRKRQQINGKPTPLLPKKYWWLALGNFIANVFMFAG